MKSKISISLAAVLVLAVSLLAKGPAIPVIVDTDAALDDMRAVILLSQSEDFDIRVIVTSDGACSPKIGAENMQREMEYLGKDNVSVGYGEGLNLQAPPWRGFTELIWREPADTITINKIGKAFDILSQELDSSGQKYLYLCLGPMTNLAYLLEHNRKARERIDGIYYRGTDPYASEPSWNTARDKDAVEQVLTYKIPIYFFETTDSEEIVFDSSMLAKITAMNSKASDLMYFLHSGDRVSQLVNSGHFGAWDESLVLSVLYPELVHYNSSDTAKYIHTGAGFDKKAGFVKYLELIKKENISR